MDNKEKNIKYFAAVVGDWHFNSLGLVRSLGESGIDVIFINLSEGGYADSSKYTKKCYHVSKKEDIIKYLFEAAEDEKGIAVIFPASDEAALIIDENRSILESKCICPGFNGNISEFMDKERMGLLAAETGFNVPSSLKAEIKEGFEKALSKFPLPFIIKPIKSVEGSKSDIMICRNSEQLKDAVKLLSSDESSYSEILVQQFVEGNKNLMVEYCGCKTPGRKVEIFGQLEKIREYPVNRGSTTYAVIKEEITYLNIEMFDRFLDMTGFSGLFDLELKIVDDVPYFLEINYRNGAPSYGFTKAGFNIPFTWYCQQTGTEKAENTVNETYLMSERDDLNNVKDKNISLFRWIKDIRKTDTMMIFNKKDHEPFSKSYNPVICKIFSLIHT